MNSPDNIMARIQAYTDLLNVKNSAPDPEADLTAIKYDHYKPQLGLLPSRPLVEIAKVLMFGAKKYDRHNWRRPGMAWSRLYDATLRHLLAWNEGEDYADDSGLNHIAHAACNLLFLLEYITNEAYAAQDDRHKGELNESR